MNYEKKLTEYMRWYQGQVTKILNKHYEGLSKTVGSTKFASKTQQSIWAANPTFAKKINNQLIAMNQDVYLKIRQGIYAGWNLADDMNDGLVHKFINGEQYASSYVSKPLKGIYMARNVEAAEAFMVRKGIGMGLSDRVWNLTKQAKSQLELTLVNGINKGTSAADLARQTQQYLKNPDALFRSVRAKEGISKGKLRLSKPAKDYNPGRGVYRSSYKNALRMTGTEINMSYRMSDYHRRQNLNFVIGVRVFLSTAHPFPDICDEFQGDYPKGFIFPGWHPKCICQTESILAKPSIASKYIAGGEIPNKYQINKIPGRAHRHVKKILPKINKATNKPYWYNYNYKNGVLNKGLAPVKRPGQFSARDMIYKEAGTITEAQQIIQNSGAVLKADYSGFTINQANAINRGLMKSFNKTKIRQPINAVRSTKTLDGEFMGAGKVVGKDIVFNPNIDNLILKDGAKAPDLDPLRLRIKKNKVLLSDAKKAADTEYSNILKKRLERYEKRLLEEEKTIRLAYADNIETVAIHEHGHYINFRLEESGNLVSDFLAPSERRRLGLKWSDSIQSRFEYIANMEGRIISDFAMKNELEYFAEAWTAFVGGDYAIINKELLKIFRKISI